MTMRTTHLSCGLLALLLAACTTTTPGGTRPDGGRPAPPRDEAPRPVTRTVQGFRIQIVTTAERAEADQHVARAIDWWQGLAPSARPPYLGDGDLAVDVKWKQPYYRVHLGAFASRSEAEEALRAVARRFPDAFIVPETVTVTR